MSEQPSEFDASLKQRSVTIWRHGMSWPCAELGATLTQLLRHLYTGKQLGIRVPCMLFSAIQQGTACRSSSVTTWMRRASHRPVEQWDIRNAGMARWRRARQAGGPFVSIASLATPRRKSLIDHLPHQTMHMTPTVGIKCFWRLLARAHRTAS